MEISNQNIIKTLCDNEERPLNEHTLRLQRIRRFYGENIIACNNINIESFKKGGIIDIVIPERDVLVFQQIEKLIRSKE